MERHQILEQCRKELAMNFDRPARDILAYYGSKLGLTADQMDRLLREDVVV